MEQDAESRIQIGPSSTTLTWECPDLRQMDGLPDGLTGYSADGCGFSGLSGNVLLPGADIFLAVPPGAVPELEIIPEGIRYVSGGTVSSVSVSSDGIDLYEAAIPGDVPESWGTVMATGTFRRAGYIQIRLHPVVSRSGALYTADRLIVRLSYPSSGYPSAVNGVSGTIFDALFLGGNQVWSTARGGTDSSPFWGLPWYSLDIDTAGIFCVRGSDVPMLEGAPSASLALFCGRGREMGVEPWENMYSPRPVPVLVEDGGDGTFDSNDRFFFFGRGLAWWESENESMPSHFNHRYCDRNTYWLTWGGENGARMNVQNGELTGAPAMPDSFLARHHFEENTVRTTGIVDIADEWAWLRSEGSTDTWHYFNFDAPGAEGSGYLRIKLASSISQTHQIRILLNGTEMCDTSWTGNDEFLLDCSLNGILESGNSLSLNVIRRQGMDTVYLDWFEVFGWSDGPLTGQTQIPLEWWPVYDRQKFSWGSDLGNSMVFLVGADTLAENITVSNPQEFEFDIPSGWQARELWISDSSDLPSPLSIRYESPGRIIGTIDGAYTVYVSADEFYEDIAPLTQGSGDVIAVSTSEVYDEFNGGVRDPRAIQSMVSWMIDSWHPIPADLILVGGGTWDPLNFITSRISYIDILYLIEQTALVSDDVFATAAGSFLPQIAVSRMSITNRSDLQLIVDRSLAYRSNENSGKWQTVVLGAADDERSPLHNNDELYHTQGVERILMDTLPDVVRPEKMYLIFYEWNSVWSKPQAREDYIDMWSEGALISFYLGHGAYDQLADEGLLYLEDAGLLACENRLPVAFFGSCDVGQFQNPASECLAQQVTTAQAGGAILGMGATDKTSGPLNEVLLTSIFDYLFSEPDLSIGMCVTLGKISSGYGTNMAQYILFGDGSLELAFPWESFQVSRDTVHSGEVFNLSGTAPDEGIVFIESFESCQPDTYYTFRETEPIGYMTIPSLFFSGTVYAEPGFSADMFVPVDSDTGRLARTQLTFLDNGGIAAASTYPALLIRGNPLPDSSGPQIEIWIEGYRNVSNPVISGEVFVKAILSDSSGINLLGNTGRQLALYVDGTAGDVSDCFQYNTGSSTTGNLRAGIGVLEPGNHDIQLRASDGLLNSSTAEIQITVTEDNSLGIYNVFPYPNPCSDETTINWTQSSPGRVNITIYTVAGRRIKTFGNIEAAAGYNQCLWDCRDADGDAVASGTYIFIVSAASISENGEASEASGIIAVVRNS
jgi:hypothetical protein